MKEIKFLFVIIVSLMLIVQLKTTCVFANEENLFDPFRFSENEEKLKQRYDCYNWPGKQSANIFVDESQFNVGSQNFVFLHEGKYLVGDYFVIRRNYMLENNNGRLLMEKTIAQTSDLAHKYLIKMLSMPRVVTSLPTPFLPGGEEMVSDIGDIGFVQKSDEDNNLLNISFIRNNFVIRLRAEGAFSRQLLDIARTIDNNMKKNGAVVSSGAVPKAEIILDANTVEIGEKIGIKLNIQNIAKDKTTIVWERTEGELMRDSSGNVNYYWATIEGPQKLSVLIVDKSGKIVSSSVEINVVRSK